MPETPKSLNVSLTPELTRFITSRVASGRYQTASEVVRAALRLLRRSRRFGTVKASSKRSCSTGAAGRSHPRHTAGGEQLAGAWQRRRHRRRRHGVY